LGDFIEWDLQKPDHLHDTFTMSTKSRLTVAEYFAGIGLMRLGLEQAGWQTVLANDLDEKKRAMYRHHFGPSPELVPDDIHLLEESAIPTTSLATASFPCNDLSLAGARRGLSGSHSSAFWGFVRILEKMGVRRPPIVLLENVTGFLTSNGGTDFHEALLALNDLGYSVDAFIIDAARFVPQSRQRLFVVGRRNVVSHVAETPTLFESELRPAALADFILWHPDVQWNLRQLPPLPRSQTKLADILEELSPNSSAWWNLQRCEYLLNQMSPKHRAQADAMIHAPNRSYATVFRRVRASGPMAELRTDGIAGCLRTPRGGSGRQILFAAGKGRFAVRLLTGRECARLQGADDFRLNVPLNHALFGFGDAVCVPAIRWIAENYLSPLFNDLHAYAKETDVHHGTIRYGEARKGSRATKT
jgi:DNA (cytosine-5)-methyltransferase 1